MSTTPEVTPEKAKFDKDILVAALGGRIGGSVFALIMVNAINMFCLYVLSFRIELMVIFIFAVIAFFLAKYVSDWFIHHKAKQHVYSKYASELSQKGTESFVTLRATLFICFVVAVVPTFTSLVSSQEYFLEKYPVSARAVVTSKSAEASRGMVTIGYQYKAEGVVYDGETQIHSGDLGVGDSVNILYCSSIYSLSKAYPE